MNYGYFDDAQREYVITRPDTPLPWINYLGSQEFFGIISNTAGGYTFFRDARLRRLTRYRYNNVPADTGGRYIYLRDDSTGAFWSPSWRPTQSELQNYTCRHGMGYTIIRSTFSSITAETCYFVPPDENIEIWQVTLKNERRSPAALSVFSAVEWCLWDALDDSSNFQRNYSTGQVEVEGSVIYHKTEYRERREHFAYFACSAPLAGFDTQRETFLGAYRGWERPLCVENGAAGNSIAHGWSPIGSHHVHVHLAPGNTRTLIFLLGYAENRRDEKFDPADSQTINKRKVSPLIAHYLQPENVTAAFTALRRTWDELLAHYQVETPNLHTNRMVNIWNAYQCMITFNMSRSASLFESGIGRGMGFRDSNQDLLGFVHMLPNCARQRILDLAATQLSSGGAYHQYQPLTKRGNNDVGSNFNDDPLWLVLAVSAYIKETGDWSILSEPTPYDNLPGSEMPLFDHLERCIQYTLERLGPHGLPLIGRADWNDCLNLNCFSDTPGQSFQTTTNKDGKIAESVFIAGLFVMAVKEMAGLTAGFADTGQLLQTPASLKQKSAKYLAAVEDMTRLTLTVGWDGAWFRRAYDDYGQPIGSNQNEEGQIFIEPQGICVMAGIGLEEGQAAAALTAVKERLATIHGIILQQPAYSKYYLHLGEISSYPPGYKENAGIFCHTNPWIMIAEARLGHGEQAFDYYLRINPSNREAISELHRCEPYIYAQMIAGRDAPTHGEAKNSWLSGTAAWNYVAITQWILGVRPELTGLRVDPCIPADWDGFQARRIFRGTIYDIQVVNPDHVCHGVKRLVIDGQEQPDQLVPVFEPGSTHTVDVYLG